MKRLLIALPLALAACGQEPTTSPVIEDFHAPYVGKWQPGDPRPMPRPTVVEPGQRIFPACDRWPLEDCGSTFTPPAPAGRPDVPAFDFTPELPTPPQVEPTPEVEPEPEPAPEPETPEPQPEPEAQPEKPAKEWGPA